MPARKKKVVCAMSGGVDSSVAAALLKADGYEVIGAFMRLGSPDGVEHGVEHQGECAIDPAAPARKTHKQGCCSVLDADDARRVAAQLDIPLYVLNFQQEFGRVIDYFVDEYNRGRTPNPCVRCNDWLKFGKLAKYAEAIGADFVASGHYARIGFDREGRRVLMRGLDHKKDQSYVLFGMSPAAIEHSLLPIGEFEKPAVRKLAEDFKLTTFNKPDSQEICFVPNQDYAGLVRRRAPDRFATGAMIDTAGNPLGGHAGHQQFTIGQRKGTGIALGYPIYVVGIDAEKNTVTLGPRAALLKSRLAARSINLLADRARNAENLQCTAKIRYNAAPQLARLTVRGPDEIVVAFEAPQSAITPGQAVVCYDGDVVLGGGWIDGALD